MPSLLTEVISTQRGRVLVWYQLSGRATQVRAIRFQCNLTFGPYPFIWNYFNIIWSKKKMYMYYTHTHARTHTGHFIRYTLLVPGWTPFCLQNCLNSSWKHFSEILVHIDMIASRSCCRFVGCTSMSRISRSTTSQRCSIGLRSGKCGGLITWCYSTW